MDKPNAGQEGHRLHREIEGQQVRVYERRRDPLLEGREVTVRRSNGAIEKDWRIIRFEQDGHIAVVLKMDKEDLQKSIPVKELEELNPPRDGF